MILNVCACAYVLGWVADLGWGRPFLYGGHRDVLKWEPLTTCTWAAAMLGGVWPSLQGGRAAIGPSLAQLSKW